MSWNPKSARGNRISFSEASALAKCEEAWTQQYRHAKQYTPANSMLKGTLLGVAANAFWLGPNADGFDWRSAMAEAWDDEEFAQADESVWDDTLWLMDRYVRWYADMRDEVEVVHTELELEAQVPGTKTTVMGHLDEVWRWRDRLYMVERKSYGRQDRLDILHVDPQLGLYPWLARENGLDLYGVLFDGIYTQRWALEKPTQKQLIEDAEAGRMTGQYLPWEADDGPWVFDAEGKQITPAKRKQAWARHQVEQHPGIERPLADSFDLTPIVRTEAQMERTIELWLKPAISRRTALRRGAVPVRNLNSMSCRFCSVRESCWDDLAFGAVTYEVED